MPPRRTHGSGMAATPAAAAAPAIQPGEAAYEHLFDELVAAGVVPSRKAVATQRAAQCLPDLRAIAAASDAGQLLAALDAYVARCEEWVSLAARPGTSVPSLRQALLRQLAAGGRVTAPVETAAAQTTALRILLQHAEAAGSSDGTAASSTRSTTDALTRVTAGLCASTGFGDEEASALMRSTASQVLCESGLLDVLPAACTHLTKRLGELQQEHDDAQQQQQQPTPRQRRQRRQRQQRQQRQQAACAAEAETPTSRLLHTVWLSLELVSYVGVLAGVTADQAGLDCSSTKPAGIITCLAPLLAAVVRSHAYVARSDSSSSSRPPASNLDGFPLAFDNQQQLLRCILSKSMAAVMDVAHAIGDAGRWRLQQLLAAAPELPWLLATCIGVAAAWQHQEQGGTSAAALLAGAVTDWHSRLLAELHVAWVPKPTPTACEQLHSNCLMQTAAAVFAAQADAHSSSLAFGAAPASSSSSSSGPPGSLSPQALLLLRGVAAEFAALDPQPCVVRAGSQLMEALTSLIDQRQRQQHPLSQGMFGAASLAAVRFFSEPPPSGADLLSLLVLAVVPALQHAEAAAGVDDDWEDGDAGGAQAEEESKESAAARSDCFKAQTATRDMLEVELGSTAEGAVNSLFDSALFAQHPAAVLAALDSALLQPRSVFVWQEGRRNKMLEGQLCLSQRAILHLPQAVAAHAVSSTGLMSHFEAVAQRGSGGADSAHDVLSLLAACLEGMLELQQCSSDDANAENEAADAGFGPMILPGVALRLAVTAYLMCDSLDVSAPRATAAQRALLQDCARLVSRALYVAGVLCEGRGYGGGSSQSSSDEDELDDGDFWPLADEVRDMDGWLPGFEELLQDGLMPAALRGSPPHKQLLAARNKLRSAAARYLSAAARAQHRSGSDSARDKAKLQLAEALISAGTQLCAVLPTTDACNATECINTSLRTEEERGTEGGRCSRCHCVRYCSRECQRDHYPAHKAVCKVLAAAQQPQQPRQQQQQPRQQQPQQARQQQTGGSGWQGWMPL